MAFVADRHERIEPVGRIVEKEIGRLRTTVPRVVRYSKKNGSLG